MTLEGVDFLLVGYYVVGLSFACHQAAFLLFSVGLVGLL